MEEEQANEQRKRYEFAFRKFQEEQQKKELMKRFLDNLAYERLMNIRASNPEFYNQIVNLMIQLIQSQQIRGKISEKQFVSLLEKITSRHEPTISFKHK
ncbi:DNA-binding protein [Candidatus Marsarchaeota archaeon]|jgi:programmed cell death protein 5|nr:DNA-binding protein [Candidatus Marsarchaeota archaeon]MCL5090273.1 DNA-binding protein [Candidatus Marsarchaeota archaeon]